MKKIFFILLVLGLNFLNAQKSSAPADLMEVVNLSPVSNSSQEDMKKAITKFAFDGLENKKFPIGIVDVPLSDGYVTLNIIKWDTKKFQAVGVNDYYMEYTIRFPKTE